MPTILDERMLTKRRLPPSRWLAVGMQLCLVGTATADDGALAYVARVRSEPRFASMELDRYSIQSPSLTAYLAGLAMYEKCRFTQPTGRLARFAEFGAASRTTDGMKMFIAFRALDAALDPASKEGLALCRKVRQMVESGEAEAAIGEAAQ